MTVLPGHEDLKPKEILGFDNMGFALVRHDESVRRYKLLIGPGGAVAARPFVEDTELPDQLRQQERPLRIYDQTE